MPDRPCSGYLVRTRNTRVLIDAGSGVMAQLLRHHQLEDVDAVWLTHVHPDHASDLGLIRNAIAYGRARGDGRIDVIGPSGWRAWFDAAVPDRDATERAFHCVEVPDRGSFTVGDITMVAFAVRHPVPTIGCRLSAEGVELAFSADSGPCPALLELCARVDLFLCEAFLSGPSAETSNIVMTPEQAGAAAQDAGAKRLVLTHLHPEADPERALERARSKFNGPIAVASPGAVFQVAPG